MAAQRIPWNKVKYHWELYLFIVPTLIFVALFQYYPALSGMFHSLYNWNGADIVEYVGFYNYKDLLFNTPDFWPSFKLAFMLGGWAILKMIPALAVAVAIHRCRSVRMQFFYRAMFVVPMVIPGLVVVLIWRSFFFEATAGYLNRFLNFSGMLNVLAWLDHALNWGGIFAVGKNPVWLGDPRLIIISIIVWGFPWVGSFAVLMHLAKLQGIPRDVYEAADVDGVSWWTKFTKVELPLIMGSIYILLVFTIIDTIKDAGMILALVGLEGGPGGVATVPSLFMLRKAFIDQKMGYACAVGIILTIVVMILQKISTLLLDITDRGPLARLAVRIGLLTTSMLLIFWANLWIFGAGLFLAAFPYAWVGDKIAMLFTRKAPVPGPALNWFDRTLGSSVLLKKIGSMTLRFTKHGFIWGVLAFAFLPLYLMVVVSFKSNTQFYAAPVALAGPFHFENWKFAWAAVTPCVANSIFVSTSATFLALMLAMCSAYFFARRRMPMSGFLWNALLLLMMMPTIANLVPLFTLLKDLNMLNTLSALILVGATAGQVSAVFVLRNFLEDIPPDMFEAAEIDGAGYFQQLRIVAVPLSGPIIGTVGVMQFIGAWNDFLLPLIVIRDHSRLPVMVELLRMAGEYIKLWGPLMAGYAIASIPVIVLFLFTMKLFVQGLSEGALKG